MKRILGVFLFAAAAFAQSNVLVLCDQQAAQHCFSLYAPASLPADYAAILPSNNAAGYLHNDGSGNLTWAGALPLTGGTMTGAITLAGGFGNGLVVNYGTNIVGIPDPTGTYHQSQDDCANPPAYIGGHTYNIGDIASSGGTTYTSSTNGNTTAPPGANWMGVPGYSACIDDRPRFDWYGIEVNFLRIKGKGASYSGGVWTNASTGDYFDLTRYQASGAILPPHMFQLVDSSFQTLLLVDERTGLASTQWGFTGAITASAGFISNLGYYSATAAYNVFSAPNGGFAGLRTTVSDSMLMASLGGATPASGCGSGFGGLGYKSASTYYYCNGSAWTTFDFSAAGGASQWTLTGSLLYPNSTSTKVLVGRNTDDGSGAMLQLTGNLNASGIVQSYATGTNVALQVNSGTFQVLGNGLVGAANYNVGTSGVIEWNGQQALRYSGGHLQFSDNGSSWANILQSSTVTSVFGRTGSVTAQSGDYFGIYTPLNGSGTSGTWPISVTGSAASLSGSLSQCASGSAATGINSIGAAQGCTAYMTGLPTSIVIPGEFYSTTTGPNNAFVASNTQILGNGNILTNGYVNAAGGYYYAGSQVVSSAGWISNVQIGAAASIYIKNIAYSTAMNCSGVGDGWFTSTNDGYLSVCLGGNRYRVALTAF